MGSARRWYVIATLAACSYTPERTTEAGDDASAACAADWLDPAWHSRIPLQIAGSNVVGAVDLPMLIDLAGAELGTAQPRGGDLVFASADGTRLAYELDTFDRDSGALVAWVRVGLSETVDTTLFVYFDHPTASGQSAPAAVWHDHSVVLHLSGDPSLQIVDSSPGGRHAIASGAMTAADQLPGKIGGSLRFDGNDDGLDLPSFALAATFTYEAWVSPTPTSRQWRCIVNNDPSYDHWFGLNLDDLDFWDGSSEHIVPTSIPLDGSWRFVVATYDGTTLRMFRDGVMVGATPLTLPTINAPFQVGYTAAQADEHFVGQIDEVRVSTVERSADFVATSFKNQNDPRAFAAAGPIERCE